MRRNSAAMWTLVAAAVVLVAGVTTTTLGARAVNQAHQDAAQASFDRRAALLEADLVRAFSLPVEVLYSIRSMFLAKGGFSRAEFESFVRDALRRHPSIAMLEWAPVVRHADRVDFEARIRAEGSADFRILESRPSGELVPAAVRPSYVPLTYIVPPSAGLGFDLLSEPSRVERLRRVNATDVPTASEPFRHVEDAPGTQSTAVYAPVRLEPAGEVVGYAIAIFRLNTMLEYAISEFGRYDIAFALVDSTEGFSPIPLYSSAGATTLNEEGARTLLREVDYRGRTWALQIWDRRPRQLAPAAVILLWGGLLVSCLLAFGIGGWAVVLQMRASASATSRLGRYTLVEKLGEGGMGVVYRATHSLLRRDTAIKVLSVTRDAEAVARFEREVRLTAKLTHPNTVAVYDYGRTRSGEFYYVMELLNGLDLHELVEQHGPQPPGRVVHVMQQVAGALAEAHEVGLIHRDIKPENIMLTCRGRLSDFTKVFDFGLVKDVRRDSDQIRLTQANVVLGTPHYVAPEAAQRLPFDGRADVYSLAAVAYYMLTGTDVFQGRTAVELVAKHVQVAPQPPSARLGRRIPESFERLLLRCLAKDPADRPTADELLDLLENLDDVTRWTPRDAWRWWAEFRPDALHPAEFSTTLPPGMKPRRLDVALPGRES